MLAPQAKYYVGVINFLNIFLFICLIDKNNFCFVASKPEISKLHNKSKNEPNRGFKTADDGRLLIDDLEGSDSADDENPKSKSRVALNMDSDSDSGEFLTKLLSFVVNK